MHILNTHITHTHTPTHSAGGYDYDFVDVPHPDDYCAICLLPARDPQQTRCECAKLYCRSCYDKQRSSAGTCPTCRQPLDAFPDRNISRRVRSLRVKCTASTDCPWVNELRLLEEHIKMCGYVLIPCSNGCGHCTVRDMLLYHCTEVCPLRQYTCVHCKGVGTYKDMISFHLDVCPDAMVACPNRGCGTNLKRKDMVFHCSECPNTMVPCPNRGCGESVKRKDIASHCSECPDATIPCPNGGCGASVKRKDLASHSSECQYETIGCTYMNIGCTFRSQRPEMADHTASSSEYHLDLATAQLKKQGEGIIIQLKEQHQIWNVEEIITQLKEQHQKQVKEVITQLKVQHQEHMEEIMTKLKEQYLSLVEEIEKTKMHNEKPPTDLSRLKPSGEHVVLKMPSFQHHKVTGRAWCSPGFYTHSHGYKMCLKVHANGSANGEGTHLSIYLFLMKGENDDDLIWPLRYSCTVTLLNQLMDDCHQAKTFTYSKDEKDRCNSRVETGQRGTVGEGTTVLSVSGHGYAKFIAHDQLDLNEVGQCQYLMEDCLYFRVQVKVLPPPKPWLVPTTF